MNEMPIIPKGYHIDIQLYHDDLITFVRSEIKKLTAVTAFYWAFNLLIVAYAFYIITKSELGFFTIFSNICLGIIGLYVLVPIHELIHGACYKISGAPSVQYKALWRKMVFFAAADGFLVSKRWFVFLAIAPFVVLNSILIYLVCHTSDIWFWSLLGTLLFHSGGCAGDFAMISYFIRNWKNEPLTYDDMSKKESYFLLKRRN
jgi:hypothetical protein